jgi:hypothetical protein
MSTTTTPRFDHLPGEESNRIAVRQIRQKDLYHESVEKLNQHNDKYQKLRSLSPAALVVIIMLSVACVGFIIGDGIFSWDVFQDKISPELLGEGKANKGYTIAIIAFFSCIAIACSILLKQPWSKSIPNLDLNPSSQQETEVYSGRAQGLTKFRPKQKRNVSNWIWFTIGLFGSVTVGIVLYNMSVERETYLSTTKAYDSALVSNDEFEGYKMDNAPIESNNNASEKLPMSVYLPVLFYAMEVATGWALLPMFMLLSYGTKRSIINGKINSFRRRAIADFNEIVTVFPAYTADIEEYNQTYNRRERAITPNPELREVLHIYDNNGNALTRMRRINDLDDATVTTDGSQNQSQATSEIAGNGGSTPEVELTTTETAPSPIISSTDEETRSDINFFDNNSII